MGCTLQVQMKTSSKFKLKAIISHGTFLGISGEHKCLFVLIMLSLMGEENVMFTYTNKLHRFMYFKNALTFYLYFI